MFSTTESYYQKQNANTPKICAITSLNPGNGVMKRWTNQPTPPIPGVTSGSDVNNMNAAFGLVDAYGLPITNTNAAPDFNGNVSGLQTPDTSGYQVAYTDGWIALPVGVVNFNLGFRNFGNTASGVYAGYAQKYAKRIVWSSGYVVAGGAIDASLFPELCGRKIVFVRLYTVNGYFHGGFYLQWNIGAGFVDVPTASTHGSQPYQSKYP